MKEHTHVFYRDKNKQSRELKQSALPVSAWNNKKQSDPMQHIQVEKHHADFLPINGPASVPPLQLE